MDKKSHRKRMDKKSHRRLISFFHFFIFSFLFLIFAPDKLNFQ